jgi:hypothetical protein
VAAMSMSACAGVAFMILAGSLASVSHPPAGERGTHASRHPAASIAAAGSVAVSRMVARTGRGEGDRPRRRSRRRGIPAAVPGARNLFVAQSGSDARGTGSRRRPFRTLGGATRVLRPGDTVYVRGGVYREELVITRSGTPEAPITFRSFPGESVILDGSGLSLAPTDQVVLLWNVAHVRFRGFEIRNSSGRGLGVVDSSDVVVRDNDVHDVQAQAMVGSGTDLTFTGNEIYRAVLTNAAGGSRIGWPAVLSTWLRSDGTRSTNVTFDANNIHDCWGEGIIALHANRVQIVRNVVRDVWSVSIYVDNAAEVDVRANQMDRTTDAYNRNGWPAYGILLANEFYDGVESRPIEDIRIADNTIARTSSAVAYWHDGRRTAGNTYRNVLVQRNTMQDTTGSPFAMDDVPDDQPQPTGNVAEGNIIHRGADGTTLSIGDPDGWVFSSNVYPDGAPPGGA